MTEPSSPLEGNAAERVAALTPDTPCQSSGRKPRLLIVGAGISGIGAAHHLQTHCPGHSYAILERRANIGGTWDFFKYPGIRSDSDMFTFGSVNVE